MTGDGLSTLEAEVPVTEPWVGVLLRLDPRPWAGSCSVPTRRGVVGGPGDGQPSSPARAPDTPSRRPGTDGEGPGRRRSTRDPRRQARRAGEEASVAPGRQDEAVSAKGPARHLARGPVGGRPGGRLALGRRDARGHGRPPALPASASVRDPAPAGGVGVEGLGCHDGVQDTVGDGRVAAGRPDPRTRGTDDVRPQVPPVRPEVPDAAGDGPWAPRASVGVPAGFVRWTVPTRETRPPLSGCPPRPPTVGGDAETRRSIPPVSTAGGLPTTLGGRSPSSGTPRVPLTIAQTRKCTDKTRPPGTPCTHR